MLNFFFLQHTVYRFTSTFRSTVYQHILSVTLNQSRIPLPNIHKLDAKGRVVL